MTQKNFPPLPGTLSSTGSALDPVAVSGLNSKLNWLRAGILGANDGIVSISALLLGVIATNASTSTVLLSGVAATIAGAVSMALGEFVSVSAQRDNEHKVMEQEYNELLHAPGEERAEIAGILENYGMSTATAYRAAIEIGRNDPFRAHLQIEYGIDPHDLTSPLHAAVSSAAPFLLGALLPLLTVFLIPDLSRVAGAIAVTAVTLLALAITGYVSARIGGTSPVKSVLRLTIGGILGLALTFGAGYAFGAVA